MAFPTSIEAATYFLVAYNNLSTTLSQICGISDSTVYVASTDNFPSIGWFTCEDEIRYYTGKTSGSFTGCVPGSDDTTAAEHAAGKAVSLTIPAVAYNRIVTELRAVMTALGAGFTLTDYATMGKNLILNPDFTSYNIDTNLPDMWTLALTPTLAIATDTLFPSRGGNQITITGNGAANEGINIVGGTANWLRVLPSTTYTIAIDYKVTAGDQLNFSVFSYNDAVLGTNHVNASLAATASTRVTYTFTTDADADNLRINIKANADTDVCVISHPKLEQGAIATPYAPQDREQVTKLTEASNATPDPAIWSKHTQHIITAQAAAITGVSIPSGTPYDGDTLLFRIEDNGTGRAITWNAIYEACGTTPPTTTTASKKLYVGFVYNSANTKWDCVFSSEEA